MRTVTKSSGTGAANAGSGPYRKTKRVLDRVGSLLVLLLLWPVFLIIALIVFLDDPKGSPFFIQQRVGENGKLFKLYKFRTMIVDAVSIRGSLEEQNEADGPVFKIKDDPRITRVGHFLRKCGLDELPQFLNVLKGDMSIVGPRPPLPEEVAQYNEYQKQRLQAPMGITCLWQIQPERNSLSFDEWVELDLRYIRECSFRMDLKILVKTFLRIFRMDGQ